MKVLLLIVTAIIAYALGNFNGGFVLTRFLFRRNRKKYMKGTTNLLDFYKDFGIPGAVALVVYDFIRTVLAVMIGGLLMSVVGEPVIGRVFGTFCLLLGNAFPLIFLYRGSSGLLLAGFAAFMVDWRVGLCCWVMYIVVIIFSRYVVLGTVVGVIVAPIFMWIFSHTGLEGLLMLFCALIVIFRNLPRIKSMAAGKQPRLDFGMPKSTKPWENKAPEELDELDEEEEEDYYYEEDEDEV